MKTIKNPVNPRFGLLIMAVILLSNGCGFSEGFEEASMIFEIFDRSIFNSLPGIY